MDRLEQRLTEAGEAWRRSRRPVPDLEAVVAQLERQTAARRWSIGAALAAMLAALVLAVGFGPQLLGSGLLPPALDEPSPVTAPASEGPSSSTSAASDDPSSVWLLTASEPERRCLLIGLTGQVVADPRSGLAIAGVDGSVLVTRWPFGFTAHRAAGRVVLVDPAGRAVAREGDKVQVGGGGTPFTVCPGFGVRVIEPSAGTSAAPWPSMVDPTADLRPTEPPLLEPPWPGLPTMRVGDITVAVAGTGGCRQVLYRDDNWAYESCGPSSFPLDVAPTTVPAGSHAVIGYDSRAQLAWGTFGSYREELSVRAAPIGSLSATETAKRETLPSGAATLDLVTRFDSASGTILTAMPDESGDYLVEVSAAIRVGDWTWVEGHFYYRVLVP